MYAAVAASVFYSLNQPQELPFLARPHSHQHPPNPSTTTMAKKSHEAAHNEDIAATRQRQPYDYGGNPLAHIHSTDSARLPAFGGAAQPGLYKPPKTQIANPAPLGLAGFALTTFLLSCVNLGVRGLAAPTIVIAPALVYGGFIQLLAGMWEIAVGEFCLACEGYVGFVVVQVG